MTDDMADEQLGRAWCEANGKRPDHCRKGKDERLGMRWKWVYDDGPEHALPRTLFNELDMARHRTEANAYAAVGAALRQLRRRAAEITDVLGEVSQ